MSCPHTEMAIGCDDTSTATGASTPNSPVGSFQSNGKNDSTEKVLPYQCWSCGRAMKLPRCPGSTENIEWYFQQVEDHGWWRVGDHLYIPDAMCDMRHVRVDLAKAREDCLTANGDFQSKKLKGLGRRDYKELYVEFISLDLDLSSAHFSEMYELYEKYQLEREPDNIASETAFHATWCRSVIGTLSAEGLLSLNTCNLQKPLDKPDLLKGSCFARITKGGQLVAMLMLDFFGCHGLAIKTFIYDPEAKFCASATRALIYKCKEIGFATRAPHLYLSVYDPKNERTRYKSMFFPVCDVLCRGRGWISAEEAALPDGTWREPM